VALPILNRANENTQAKINGNLEKIDPSDPRCCSHFMTVMQ